MKQPQYEPLKMGNPKFAAEYGRKLRKYNEFMAKKLASMTIVDHLREFIDNNNVLSGTGNNFTGQDFSNIEKVLSGKADNFIIFSNAGGKMFDIWMYDVMKKQNKKCTLKGFLKFVESQKSYIYMQKVKGKETIFTRLPSAKKKDDVFQQLVNILG